MQFAVGPLDRPGAALRPAVGPEPVVTLLEMLHMRNASNRHLAHFALDVPTSRTLRSGGSQDALVAL